MAIGTARTYHRATGRGEHPGRRPQSAYRVGDRAGRAYAPGMDPASGIGIPVAFGAGLISFLSPCVLPLVPGLHLRRGRCGAVGDPRARVIGPSLAFVASFSVIFIALGLLGPAGAARGAHRPDGAQGLRRADRGHGHPVRALARSCPRLAREWHVGRLMQRAGRGGPVLTGAAFALAWTPCTGPTLGAIVTAAGASGSATHGAFLLAVYCAGLGVPFLHHRAGLRDGDLRRWPWSSATTRW